MKKILESGKFSYGVNYWGSKYAIEMWSKWDIESIENDLKVLAENAVDTVRVFPTWSDFQPICAHFAHENLFVEFRHGEEPLPDTEAGMAGVDEKMMERFEIFCDLCDKYKLKVVVSLLTGFMSGRMFVPKGLERLGLITDATAILWEVKFCKYFVKRMKHRDCIIAWEHGNECVNFEAGITDDQFTLWMHIIADAIKSQDIERPVIGGLEYSKYSNNFEIGQTIDFSTVHPYHIFYLPNEPTDAVTSTYYPAALGAFIRDLGGKPTFVEEVGAIGYMNCGKKAEADYMRGILWNSYANEMRGLYWWCAFDQGFIDRTPYDWNTIGSNYGIVDKNMNPKPCAIEAKRFMETVKGFPFGALPKAEADICIILPSGISADLLRNISVISFILARQAGLEPVFCDANLNALPESKLYIFPSVTGNRHMPKHRMDVLMDRVSKGATLLVTAGDCLMRDFEELTGIEVDSRYAYGKNTEMDIEGSKITVCPVWSYKADSVDGEILAKDSDGNPLFVKHGYGKGTVYFLACDIEIQLAKHKSPFYKEDSEDYYKLYSLAGKDIIEGKNVVSNDRYINVTEHRISDDEIIIIAVNNDMKERNFHPEIRNGFEISEIFEGNIDAIEKNGAVVFKISRGTK
ncbi:MAG: hypothetical protein IKU43_08915 [Clostridia bacterium]|nr:hypothetical protein [Clostridia bacterium]